MTDRDFRSAFAVLMVLIGVGVASPFSAGAQVPETPVFPGQRVRFLTTANPPEEFGGRVSAVTTDSLVVYKRSVGTGAVAWEDIELLQVSDGKDYPGSIAVGAGYTALTLGVLSGVFVALRFEPDSYFNRWTAGALSGVVGAAFGVVLGASGGILVPRDRWRTVQPPD